MTDYHHSDRSDYAGSTFGGRAEYNRAEINKARRATEALFAGKPRITEPSAPAAISSAEQTARKPRILSAVQVRTTRDDPTKSAVVSGPPTLSKEIPASHLGRIRTWLKYGMSIPQVAKVYGVGVVRSSACCKKPDARPARPLQLPRRSAGSA